MKILDLHHNGTYWCAIVYAADPPNGRTYDLDRRYGSWQIPGDDTHARRDVLPAVAATLQREVRSQERRNARVSV